MRTFFWEKRVFVKAWFSLSLKAAHLRKVAQVFASQSEYSKLGVNEPALMQLLWRWWTCPCSVTHESCAGIQLALGKTTGFLIASLFQKVWFSVLDI